MQQRYRAKWIVPIEGLPQENGVLVVEQGRIADIRKSHGLWPACDLGDVVILPGLVNAHVHLDLPGSLLASARAGGFVSWLRAVIAYRRASSQQQTESVIRQGIAESLRYGVTCLGDISADGTSARLLAAVGMKSLVFQEVLGLTRERTRETARAARWRLQNCTWNDALRGALGPHAPYSTARVLYRWAGAFAARHAIPLATHVAETLEELQLLRSRTGPLRELLEELGIWRPQALCRTIPEVLQCMSTAPRVIAVHANYCDEKTLAAAVQLFAHRPGGIVFCPRTHAAFGHEPYPVGLYRSAGIRLALGTDSRASSPDLDLLGEVRFLYKTCPTLDPRELLKMATLAGAQILGMERRAGSLRVGKDADFIAVPLQNEAAGEDPCRHVLTSCAAPRWVFLAGRAAVVEDRLASWITL